MLLTILNTSYANEIIKSLKPNGGRNVKKRLLDMWTTKCKTLVELLFQKSREESVGGIHSLTSSQ
jgi:hypothetical protein